MSQDKSAGCKCECHTDPPTGFFHCFGVCGCERGEPVLEAPQEFAMGANMPLEMVWMTGRTAGEIALIQCLLRCDKELRQVPVLEDKELRTEIDDVLRMYGVNKYRLNKKPSPNAGKAWDAPGMQAPGKKD
jgi:hypothetical protein